MPLKILFMGTPEFAVPILHSIHQSKHELLSIYTKPPKKKSRGQKVTSSPIHQCAEKLKISVRCPGNINLESEYNYIKELNPNIVVVVAYGKIIPEKILNLSGITFINIHASILQKWRGAAPIQRAIMNMDKETGISIMKIVKELDAGPVMKCEKIKISNVCNYETLSKKMSTLAASLIINSLEILEKKNEKFISQDSTKATYAKKINKLESKISWEDKAKQVVAKINALYPNPGSWFELNGSRVKVLKAKEVNKTGKPGEIIDDKFTIACIENSIQVLELKKEGKNTMDALDFLKGNKLKIGTILSGS
jgi:methionyl-tRNA formyltransferase